MPTRPPTFRPKAARQVRSNPPATFRNERIRGRKGVEQRRQFLTAHPLCARCEQRGVIAAAAEVDHIVPLSRGGANDWSNYQALCVRCHLAKTEQDRAAARSIPLSAEARARRIPSLGKPAIPVTIVCGPPGSGKSTYVAQRAGPNDLVIDLNQIMSAISGEPIHHTSSRWVEPALRERNRILASLASDAVHDRAWFIIAAPDERERRIWKSMLAAELVVLAVPAEECIRRINADPSREGQKKRMIAAVHDWWGGVKMFAPPCSDTGGQKKQTFSGIC